MKPIPIKIYLVQILLVVLAASFAFLSLSSPDSDVVFWNATWGTITHGQMSVPVVLGVVPFAALSLFFSFLFLYLLFEFYGLKMAVYTSLAIALVVLGQFYLFFGLERLSPDGLSHQPLLNEVPLSHLNQALVHATSAAIVLGFSTYFGFAWLFKKLTRHYFMFFRFALASAPGFLVLAFVKTYILKRDQLADISILMESIPQAMQFVALCVLSVIPLYLLRLILGAFRGRGVGSTEDFVDTSKPLFKAQAIPVVDEVTNSEPSPPKPANKPVEVAKPVAPPAPVVAKAEPPTLIAPPTKPVAAADAPQAPTTNSPSVFDLIDDEDEITNASNPT